MLADTEATGVVAEHFGLVGYDFGENSRFVIVSLP